MGIRTPGLVIANDALYQLSYTPESAPSLGCAVPLWNQTQVRQAKMLRHIPFGPLRRNIKMLARDRNSSSHLAHMKPDPSNKTADAIIGKKSVENADQCPRVAGVSQMPDSEVQGRGTVRKLVQDPKLSCLCLCRLAG